MARVYEAVLAGRFGIKPDGWDAKPPEWPNISEVTSDESREMKARKKAWKEKQA